MATSVTPVAPGGLARTFVEFDLLPDLLVLPGTVVADGPPAAWADFLSGRPGNLDHMEEEDEPPEAEYPATLSADAWQLARALDLVNEHGLTTAGWELAGLADVPVGERHGPDVPITPGETLARQIRACFLGQDGRAITDLLIDAAAVLAGLTHVWAEYCPGLLLVEFESLVHLGLTDWDRAVRLRAELASNRDTAMHPHGMPSADRPPMENMLVHCDAVTAFYLDNFPWLDDFGPDIGTSRATAMLFTYCGLLRERYPLGPVHCLVPPGDA